MVTAPIAALIFPWIGTSFRLPLQPPAAPRATVALEGPREHLTVEERGEIFATDFDVFVEADAVAAASDIDERGAIVVRDVQTVDFKDKTDDSPQSKRILAIRTENGIVTIWEGPGVLTSRLFDGEQRDGDPLGPPVKGQLVIVEYKGERTSAAGNAYKLFEVARGPLPEEAERASQDAGADDSAHRDEDPEAPFRPAGADLSKRPSTGRPGVGFK